MAALSQEHKFKNTNNNFIYSVYYIFKALKLFHPIHFIFFYHAAKYEKLIQVNLFALTNSLVGCNAI